MSLILCNYIDTGLSVNFDSNDTHYESIKITNLCELKTRISALIPQSTQVYDFRDGIKSENDLKSYDSIRIIKNTYEDLGCKFEYENTTDKTIDNAKLNNILFIFNLFFIYFFIFYSVYIYFLFIFYLLFIIYIYHL